MMFTPLKLALLGSRGHINDVLRELPDVPELRVVAVSPAGQSEPFSAVVDYCSALPVAPVFHSDWRTLLERETLDAVVVCGPFELHAEMCVAAVERGIHVLTEKPAALTREQFRRLRTACLRHPQVHVAAMMKSRFDPGFFHAHRLVRSGRVGEVRLIEARKSYKLGSRPGYYFDRETYGGTIPWVGSHAIDWTLWITGARPERVFAAHSRRHNGGVGTLESSAMVQLFLEGERLASVAIDYLRPASAATHGDDFIRVVGTEGVLEARPNSLQLIGGTQAGPVELGPVGRSQLRDFAEHILGRRKSLIDTGQTLLLTETCLAALESADSGQVVTVWPSA